jgi:hypothetical protein
VSDTDRKRIGIWAWVALGVVAVGAAAWIASTGRRPDPPQAYRYDVTEYEEVDPSLIIATESTPIDPEVSELRALATSPDGRIFAVGNKTLVVCDLQGSGLVRHRLENTPQCLAVAPSGEIVLGMLDHVEILDAHGKPKNSWPPLESNAHITSIVADAENIYVADAGNRVVLRFDHEGALQARIGEEDPDRDIPGLVVPSPYMDVMFDNTGAFWTVNPGRHGFEQYRPNGDLVSAWYRPSMELDGFCGCCNPAHAAFRSDGTLVTVEKGLVRVKLHSVDQKLLGLIAEPKAFHTAEPGPFSAELETPLLDLAVDSKNRILLIDANKNAIRVFKVEGQG